MLRILVVNNYVGEPPSLQILLQALKAARPEAQIGKVSPLEIDPSIVEDSTHIILSGSPANLTLPMARQRYRELAHTVPKSDRPLLGICFGHQLLAYSFGARIAPLAKPIRGFRRVVVVAEDRLFAGLPREIVVKESHRLVVASPPEPLRVLAVEGELPGRVEAIRHRERPIYGVQFHPERYDAAHPDGLRVIANFLAM